jgi:hypothetical protein
LRLKSTIPRGSILKMYRFPRTVQGSGEQYTLKTTVVADNEESVERLLINHNDDDDDTGKGNSGKANNKQG